MLDAEAIADPNGDDERNPHGSEDCVPLNWAPDLLVRYESAILPTACLLSTPAVSVCEPVICHEQLCMRTFRK